MKNLNEMTDQELREEWKSRNSFELFITDEIVSRFMNQKLPTKPDLSELYNSIQDKVSKGVSKEKHDILLGHIALLIVQEKELKIITLNNINK